MNSLVVQVHHQNVQISSQNLMLKQILVTSGVNVPLHIPYVPYIPYLTNTFTSITYDMPHPPTFEHLHMHLLPKKGWKERIRSIQEIFDVTDYQCNVKLSIREN